jgi:hypothetical protein
MSSYAGGGERLEYEGGKDNSVISDSNIGEDMDETDET